LENLTRFSFFIFVFSFVIFKVYCACLWSICGTGGWRGGVSVDFVLIVILHFLLFGIEVVCWKALALHQWNIEAMMKNRTI